MEFWRKAAEKLNPEGEKQERLQNKNMGTNQNKKRRLAKWNLGSRQRKKRIYINNI